MSEEQIASIEQIYCEGRKLLADGMTEAACEAFCRVLSVCPDTLDDVACSFGSADVRINAIEALFRIGDTDREGSPYLALAARLASNEGWLDNACQWAEQAVEKSPSCASWWFELGEVCRAKGNTRKAAVAYRRCISINPDHWMARNSLSFCKRRYRKRLARWLIRSERICRLLKRTVCSDLSFHFLEKRKNSAAFHQMRWANILEWSSTLALFTSTPLGLERDSFTEHMELCKCPFWNWFLARGIEKKIKTVLDVGCGTGFLTEHFVRQGYGVTGITCNPHEKKECLLRGIRVVEEDFHFFSADDDTFDLVFSSQSLEHSISPLNALWEWRRVIRPGGYMMIVLPLPVDQDSRAYFIEHYIPEIDTLQLPTTGPESVLLTNEEMQAAFFTYGAREHCFVLSYWQLTWLFQLVGLDLLAAAVEDPIAAKLYDIEEVKAPVGCSPAQVFNGIFLLQKPEKQPIATGLAGSGRL